MSVPHLSAPGLAELLGNTANDWRALQGARLFITGGTGFLGCNLLEALLYLNESLGLDLSLTVLTRSPAAFEEKAPHLAAHPALKLWAGDITRFEAPEDSFTHIIHAAAPAASSQSRQGDVDTRFHAREATARIIALARRSGVERLLYLSSGAVYGSQVFTPSKPVAESAPLRPLTAYGEAKAEAEDSLRTSAAHEGFGLAVARAFTFAGPWQDLGAGFAVTDFIRAARAGQPIVLQGPRETTRSYLYAPEAAQHLLRLLIHSAPEITCNIGSPEAVTMGELAEAVREVFCPTAPIEVLPPRQKPTYYVPDCTVAANLGLHATLGLANSLRHTRDFLDSQGL